MTQATPKTLIDAIAWFGSESELARRIGYSQSAISKAKRAGRVSAEMAAKIELASRGRIKKIDLRPDVFQPGVAVPRRRSAA